MPIEPRITPEVLAGIDLGTIRKWSDPRIKAANRDAVLGAGQHQATALGYVSIAPEVLIREQQMLGRY